MGAVVRADGADQVIRVTGAGSGPSVSVMQPLPTPPGFFANLFTLGILRASWIAKANREFGGGAGFWFAWFLQPFANYGLAGRFNAALRSLGSSHTESQILCFFLTGFPFIGAKKRLKRATSYYNDALGVRGQREGQAAAR